MSLDVERNRVASFRGERGGQKPMYSEPKTPWRISGDEVGSCNCAWGCPCQFNALPTHGRCEGLAGIHIREGYFGSTRLDGVRFAQPLWWPGAIHPPVLASAAQTPPANSPSRTFPGSCEGQSRSGNSSSRDASQLPLSAAPNPNLANLQIPGTSSWLRLSIPEQTPAVAPPCY